jgi:hypothetical protein
MNEKYVRTTLYKVAKMNNTNREYVRMAKKIKEHPQGNNLYKKVSMGELHVKDAYAELYPSNARVPIEQKAMRALLNVLTKNKKELKLEAMQEIYSLLQDKGNYERYN